MRHVLAILGFLSIFLVAIAWAITVATIQSEARAACRQAGGVYLNEGVCIKREVVLLT
jgi:hypothetical protein